MAHEERGLTVREDPEPLQAPRSADSTGERRGEHEEEGKGRQRQEGAQQRRRLSGVRSLPTAHRAPSCSCWGGVLVPTSSGGESW